ncbi:MAG: hypothetical protein NTW21_20585 [Verrucomicrobia bacterium]|nr:hypothetical protein [Verrucomicrobiota bacterium]
MKAKLFLNIVVLGALSSFSHAALTINWGSKTFSQLLDSHGTTLDDSYVFQLGAFGSYTDGVYVSYDPGAAPIGEWSGHWNVFDQADYYGFVDGASKTWGTFSGTVVLKNDGTSAYSGAEAGFDFRNLDAYLWIRKADEMVVGGVGSENLLVHAVAKDGGTAAWKFPQTVSDCCGSKPVEWSVSDLNSSDMPLYGYQKAESDGSIRRGTGNTNYNSGNSGSYPAGYLQLGAVPEPCSSVLVLVLSVLAVLDRRRAWF